MLVWTCYEETIINESWRVDSMVINGKRKWIRLRRKIIIMWDVIWRSWLFPRTWPHTGVGGKKSKSLYSIAPIIDLYGWYLLHVHRLILFVLLFMYCCTLIINLHPCFAFLQVIKLICFFMMYLSFCLN